MDILNNPGIYQLLNLVNNKSYIGQSVNLKRRGNAHFQIAYDIKNIEYDTPIHRAIRKYGKENFKLIPLEYCKREELNNKEKYYIAMYGTFPITANKGYNQTAGGDSATAMDQLYPRLIDITIDLMNSDFTQAELAHKYNCSLEMIQGINTGRYWLRDNFNYPLRKYAIKIYGETRKKIAAPGYGKFYHFSKKMGETNKCSCCGKEISPYGRYCRSCAQLMRGRSELSLDTSKETLIQIIMQYRSKYAISKSLHVGPIRLNYLLNLYNLDIKEILQEGKPKQKHRSMIGKYKSLEDIAPIEIFKSYKEASESLSVRAPSMIKKACENQDLYHGYFWKILQKS